MDYGIQNNIKDLRQHQLRAANAMCEVAKVLDKNNIRYYLLAGSTLGAVRHKGFIPWDDDIDIGILYKDKEKAYKALRTGLKNFEWIDRTVDPDYPRLYGKVLCNRIGCIDVFVLVKTSDSEFKRRIQWAKRKVLFKLYKAKIGYSHKNESENIKERIKLFISKLMSFLFSRAFIENRIEKNEASYEGLTSNTYYLNLYSAYSLEKELIRTEWLRDNNYVEFEGHKFNTVSDTDSYLTHLYGDYMTPPKKKDRMQRHGEYF